MSAYASSLYNYVGRRLSWSTNGAEGAGQHQRPSSADLLGRSLDSSSPLRNQVSLHQQHSIDSASDTSDMDSEETAVGMEHRAFATGSPPAPTGEAAASIGGEIPHRPSASEDSSVGAVPSQQMDSSEEISLDGSADQAYVVVEGSAEAPSTDSDAAPASRLALPEDDGQRQLRELLRDIHKMDISEREKAQRMHAVMTSKYNESRAQIEETITTAAAADREDPYEVTAEDAAPTYNSSGDLGCTHYKRGVKLQCSTCQKWYTCRFCHDEQESHSLIRRETKNMLCMPCGKAQPAQQDCRHCGVRTARYYCDKCKLWDDDGRKKIYHCDDCGICRIGAGLGKDFFHCKKCGVCMSMSLQDFHRCIERSTYCDCPICGDFMFTSTLTVVFMPCGHSIHHKCYYEHMKRSYRCPTCARTIVNMEAQFRALDREIIAQPLPEPYSAWRCLISCNDCSAKGNVPFHFLGLKCEECKSYNTSQVKVIRPEDVTSPTLEPLAAPPSLGQSPAVGAGGTSGSMGAAGLTGQDAIMGAATLAAAGAALVAADNAIQAAGELYDDGWDEDEEQDGILEVGDDEEQLDTDVDEEEVPGMAAAVDADGLEDDDDEEDDDFLNLTGHL